MLTTASLKASLNTKLHTATSFCEALDVCRQFFPGAKFARFSAFGVEFIGKSFTDAGGYYAAVAVYIKGSTSWKTPGFPYSHMSWLPINEEENYEEQQCSF